MKKDRFKKFDVQMITIHLTAKNRPVNNDGKRIEKHDEHKDHSTCLLSHSHLLTTEFSSTWTST